MSHYFLTTPLQHENISTLPGALWHYVGQRTPPLNSWLDPKANWPTFDRDLIAHPPTDCYIQQPQTFNSVMSMIFADFTSPSLAASSQVYTSSPATSIGEEEEVEVPAKQETILAPIPINTLAAPLKRGRPSASNARTARAASDSHKARSHHSNHRQPHHQVERKYRKSLNVEMENLRLALPLKQQRMPNGGGPEVKASEAAVLSSAVAHIYELEWERDALRKENEILKGRKR